jgi:AcrR family transcriptional regulator
MTVTAPGRLRQRKTRAEKSEETRWAIFQAAMTVVGKSGFAEATIVNITREAGVALGTFYMYFASKQDLLDQLLPWIGQLAHQFMDEAIAGAISFVDYERQYFDAFSKFLKKNPYYLRILTESEVGAPKSYLQHIERSIGRYKRALLAAYERGEFEHYREEDMETLAAMLTSSKLLLFRRYGDVSTAMPADRRRAYLEFITRGFLGRLPDDGGDDAADAAPQARPGEPATN